MNSIRPQNTSQGMYHSNAAMEANPNLHSLSRPEFKYEWRIENFSMCPQTKGRPLYSTSFSNGSLDQSEFRLVLYPRGRNEDLVENITCVLECLTKPDYKITVYISIMGCSKFPIFTQTKKCFIMTNGERIGFLIATDREKFMSKKFELFPYDVLTIQCVLIPEYHASLVSNQDLLYLSRDYSKLFESEVYSDFVINGRDGKKEYRVHKEFLIRRIPQLAKNIGLMDCNSINQWKSNMDPLVLENILGYLYSGKLEDDLAPDVLNELYETAKQLNMDDLKRNLFPLETSITACTMVKAERRIFSWPLKDFRRRIENRDWPIRTFIDLTVGRFAISFSVEIGSEETLVVPIEIRAHSLMALGDILLKCKVLVDVEEGSKPELCSGEHWFDSNKTETYTFPMIGDYGKLYWCRSTKPYFPDVSLTMEFTLSNSSSSCECERVKVINSLQPLNPACNLSFQRLSSDLEIVFEAMISGDENYCDNDCNDLHIRAKSGNIIFAHRCILASRSGKFRQLIDSMKKEQDLLDLSDISDETLQDLLRYVYSGKVKERDIKHNTDLFIAATKYEVMGLVQRCINFIDTKMTNSDIYRALLLVADNEDEHLFLRVLHCICSNKYHFLNSSKWKRLVVARPQFSSIVLSKLTAMMSLDS